MKEIVIFEINGKLPIEEWVISLKDRQIKYRINERIKRIIAGNLGDYKKIDSELSEFRLNFGSGYRIYFHEADEVIILLLCGGDKATQVKDIKKAKEFLQLWKGNNNDKKSL